MAETKPSIDNPYERKMFRDPADVQARETPVFGGFPTPASLALQVARRVMASRAQAKAAEEEEARKKQERLRTQNIGYDPDPAFLGWPLFGP